LLHHCELSQRSARYKILNMMNMNDMREVTDLVQGTRRKIKLTRTSWNMFLCAFKCA
jgi:hypothetical protein